MRKLFNTSTLISGFGLWAFVAQQSRNLSMAVVDFHSANFFQDIELSEGDLKEMDYGKNQGRHIEL